MVRLAVMTVVAMGLGLTGCQKAKMSKVEKKNNVQVNNQPPRYPPPRPRPPSYYPPPQQQQPQPPVYYPAPPQTGYPNPPPIDAPDYENPSKDSLDSADYQGQVNPPKQQGERPILGERNQTDWTDYSQLPRVMDTCRYGCAPVEPQPDEDCRENSTCERDPEPVPGECTPYTIPGKAKVQKLDILFVIDTSLSMRKLKKETGTSELADMAAQMGEFVRQLDPATDYNIGVLLAHGPATNKSPANFHGKLFRKGSKDVSAISISRLMNEEKKKGASDNEARAKAESRVVKILKNKMLSLDKSTDDHTSAQGEVGLFSLYSALTNPQLTADIKSKGLLRDDAALNVIFVSDENDVCYNYHGRSPRVADRHEKITYDGICSNAVNGQRLTEDDVLDALINMKKDQPLVVSAIIYTDANTLPAVGPNDENEIGWGYKDIVEKAHGEQKKSDGAVGLADLAGHDYKKALIQLGQFAQKNIEYDDFRCDTQSAADNINPTSFDILVYNQKNRLIRFNAACGGTDKEACPKGAKPVLSVRVDKGQYVLAVNKNQLKAAINASDESEAHVKITFLKLKEDGVKRSERAEELRRKSQANSPKPVAERDEENFEDGTAGEAAGDAAGDAAATATDGDDEDVADAPPVVKPTAKGEPTAQPKAKPKAPAGKKK